MEIQEIAKRLERIERVHHRLRLAAGTGLLVLIAAAVVLAGPWMAGGAEASAGSDEEVSVGFDRSPKVKGNVHSGRIERFATATADGTVPAPFGLAFETIPGMEVKIRTKKADAILIQGCVQISSWGVGSTSNDIEVGARVDQRLAVPGGGLALGWLRGAEDDIGCFTWTLQVEKGPHTVTLEWADTAFGVIQSQASSDFRSMTVFYR